jgi:hypothetical protein
MSLSFVSSAVQTGTSNGGYEETPIESKEVEAVNRRNEHKPLFEQLRKNQEEEEAEREEMEMKQLRGTCALDEDDVAHLTALEKQRQEKEKEKYSRTQDELAMFRAARAERQSIHLEDDIAIDEQEEEDDATKNGSSENVTKSVPDKRITATKMAPKFIVKKRKLKGTAPEPKKKVKPQVPSTTREDKKEEQNAGLGGLLGGYGSSDDDSDQ